MKIRIKVAGRYNDIDGRSGGKDRKVGTILKVRNDYGHSLVGSGYAEYVNPGDANIPTRATVKEEAVQIPFVTVVVAKEGEYNDAHGKMRRDTHGRPVPYKVGERLSTTSSYAQSLIDSGYVKRVGDKIPEPHEIDDEINATPAARRVAADLGIDLATVQGTGVGGRILQSDALAAIKD